MLTILAPDTGPTGTRVTLTGIGLTPNGKWEAYFGDVLIFEDMTLSGDTTLSGFFYIPSVEAGEYTLTVVDLDADIEVEAAFTVTARAHEIQLFEGWNLISLPYAPEDSSIEVVLADILDDVEIIWGYDMGEWSFYLPAIPHIGTLTEMVEDKGYWINMNADATLIIRVEVSKPIIVAQIKGALEADTQLTALMEDISFVDWVVVTGDISLSDLQDAMMLITVLSDSSETYTEGEVEAINNWLDEGGKAIWICGDARATMRKQVSLLTIVKKGLFFNLS